MAHSRRAKLCGTDEGSVIWCNSTDSTGIIFAAIVWLCILFAAAVCLVVVIEGDMAIYEAAIILTLIFLALWAHLKTMLGDPGAVPVNAYPLQSSSTERSNMNIAMCGRCDGYKPPSSHHGKINNHNFSVFHNIYPNLMKTITYIIILYPL
jgi:hypothetical protein